MSGPRGKGGSCKWSFGGGSYEWSWRGRGGLTNVSMGKGGGLMSGPRGWGIFFEPRIGLESSSCERIPWHAGIQDLLTHGLWVKELGFEV